MNRKEFERVARQAIAGLPDMFRPYVADCVLVVKARPSKELLEEMGVPEDEDLFGIYDGPALTERHGDDPPQMPPRIVLFYGPLLDACETEEELVREIRLTVVHEIGHFFGLEEDRLADLGFE